MMYYCPLTPLTSSKDPMVLKKDEKSRVVICECFLTHEKEASWFLISLRWDVDFLQFAHFFQKLINVLFEQMAKGLVALAIPLRDIFVIVKDKRPLCLNVSQFSFFIEVIFKVF